MCLTLVGRLRSVDAEVGQAVAEVQGSTRSLSIAPLVLDDATPSPGDWVLIHTGMAVAVIDEHEARELEALCIAVSSEEPWQRP